MKEFKFHVDIMAPGKRVWETFIDLENYGKWNPTIPSGRGILLVNNYLELNWKRSNKNHILRPKIEGIETNRRFTFSIAILHPRLTLLVHHFELEALKPGVRQLTRFTQRWECSGILLPLLWSILLPGFKEFKNFSSGLKAYLEGETPGA